LYADVYDPERGETVRDNRLIERILGSDLDPNNAA
jgi:hypothetical protein